MKRTISIARHPFCVILVLLGLLVVTPLVVEPVALAQVNPSWISTGGLNIPVSNHTATLLPNGKVLVAGGFSDMFGFHNTAELYEPATGTWNLTGSLDAFHSDHTATLLSNGKVLVAGGASIANRPVKRAELYDPASEAWSDTGSLLTARYGHTATLLPNGTVLVAGGANNDEDPPSTVASAELYDPATGTWQTTGNLNTQRYQHTATPLPNGKVLVAGGFNSLLLSLNIAELYDPATETWSGTGSLNIDRTGHTATLLPNGKVLVTGGYNFTENRFNALNSAELYDPATGTWSVTGSLNIARSDHSASLLSNGKILVAGGQIFDTWPYVSLNEAELYDPATGIWSVTASLDTARRNYTATLLPNGKVLVAGGNNQGELASAEIYTFNTALTTVVDFNGDGISDIGVYRNGTWFIRRSSNGGIIAVGWGGLAQDRPVPADYDGDGKVDHAVYRDGVWLILRSSNGGGVGITWGGAPQDIPVPVDYDGDGKSDIAVYRDGMWFIRRSSDSGLTAVEWGGAPQDIPLH
jgi:Galactose oxidase, central domain/Kelch motif